MNIGSQTLQLPSLPVGYSRTLVNEGKFTIFYGDALVSASHNQGSILAGASAVVAITPLYLVCPSGPGQFVDIPISPTLGVSLSTLAAAQPFHVTLPENFGATRDGVHDDTAGIIAAINAVVALAQADGSNYGEVWFGSGAGVYAVNGALQQGGATLGNAQIPLPVIPSTGEKFILVLRGVSDPNGFPHWQQLVQQNAGSVIVTNLNANFDATFGSPSCIGGPTAQQMGSTDGGFSNMLIVIDGITVQSPLNPKGVAVDLQACAQADVPHLACNGSIVPGLGGGTAVTMPTNPGVALRMPQVGNNDYARIGSLGVEGYGIGLIVGEHTSADRVAIIYSAIGVNFQAAQNDACRINYLSTEGCANHLSTNGAAVGGHQRCQIDIGTWDCEDYGAGAGINLQTLHHVDDPANLLTGEINFRTNATTTTGPGTNPTVSGGANAHIFNGYQSTGHQAPPAVPATAVALVNPFWRDAAVTVSGGTVTVISVDGTATGVTSGTVIVPAGKSITLTYSVAPTWNWVTI